MRSRIERSSSSSTPLISTLTFLPALSAISRAVRFFEPRVDLLSVDAQIDDALEGRFQVGVEFRVRETNSRHNVVFPYYLREGSLVAERPVVAR